MTSCVACSFSLRETHFHLDVIISEKASI